MTRFLFKGTSSKAAQWAQSVEIAFSFFACIQFPDSLFLVSEKQTFQGHRNMAVLTAILTKFATPCARPACVAGDIVSASDMSQPFLHFSMAGPFGTKIQSKKSTSVACVRC